MDDGPAKSRLLTDLANARRAVVARTEGLTAYDARRPLTPTGTNLLGLVKHLATWESRYLGEVFGRPFPEPLPRWDDRAARGRESWLAEGEHGGEVVALYARVAAHSEATVRALPLDAVGRVPWWSPPEVTLLAVLTHVLGETARHAGHADIMREQLDGVIGAGERWEDDAAFWQARHAKIEREAASASRPAPPSATRRP